MIHLYDWAKRWGVPADAVLELRAIMGTTHDLPTFKGGLAISEADVQQQIRLEAPKHGQRLWRNNNGATQDETGRQIRYGLANDSAKMNRIIKSHDLIGITPVTITHEHMGCVLGVFTSIEVKRPGWVYNGTPREVAQLNWLELVIGLGGIAKFATRPEDIWT